jgi:hypothetical protein
MQLLMDRLIVQIIEDSAAGSTPDVAQSGERE